MQDATPAPLEIPENETGALRLFGVAPGSPDEARLVAAAAAGNDALAEIAGELLGHLDLDPAWIELINTADMAELGGLEAYLVAGYDPPAAARDILRPALEQAPPRVLLVLSRAFSGRAETLHPAASLHALASVSLLHPPPTAAPMASDETAPPLDAAASGRAKPSKARVSGMAALAALLVAGALVLAMVLIGG